MEMFPFYSSWKNQENFDFGVFSGGIKRASWSGLISKTLLNLQQWIVKNAAIYIYIFFSAAIQAMCNNILVKHCFRFKFLRLTWEKLLSATVSLASLARMKLSWTFREKLDYIYIAFCMCLLHNPFSTYTLSEIGTYISDKQF